MQVDKEDIEWLISTLLTVYMIYNNSKSKRKGPRNRRRRRKSKR